MNATVLISALRGWLRMNDHGHVRPGKDKPLARCGGPNICDNCKAEQHALALVERLKLLAELEAGR